MWRRLVLVVALTLTQAASLGGISPPGKKSVSTNYSVLSSDVAAIPVRTQMYLPDLIPHAGSFASYCSWNESQGETCESQCPPLTVHIALGTRNISSRPLTGSVKVRVHSHPAGGLVKEWMVTDVPGAGTRMPGWFTKTIVRCHPPGQVTVSTPPPPNHNLVVETGASEADKNNNSRLIYVDPGSAFGP